MPSPAWSCAWASLSVRAALVGAWVVLALAGSACSSAVPPAAVPSPTDGRRIPIGVDQYGQTVQARVGDLLVIAVPLAGLQWEVVFDPEILAPAPGTSLRNPGAEGWLIRCVAVGRSPVTALAVPAPCAEGTPCPPAQLRIELVVEVGR